MDSQVKNADMKMLVFNIFKNIICEQNKVLLKAIADKYDLDYDDLARKYLTPDHYLPVIVSPKKA
jgi:hypothetical protein